jgi:hypothetical protein
VHGRRRTGVLGLDVRQRRGVGPEHVGQHVREVLSQGKPLGHLTGRGRPEARRFRLRLGPIAPKDLTPGMGLKSRGDRGGLALGEQGQGPPPCEVQQEGASGVTRPSGKILHDEDLRGADHRAGGAADHLQQGVPTDGKAERLAQPHPSRSSQGEAHGEEACRQAQDPPCRGRHKARQSFRQDGAWAGRRATAELTDAEPPGDPGVTPGEIGQRPGGATVDMPGRGLAPWASGCRLCGGDQEGDLGGRVVAVPGVQLARYGGG